MNARETTEMRELTAAEIDSVDGGAIMNLGFCKVAADAYTFGTHGWGVALGVEIGGTQYIVNVGSFGVNAWSQPAP
jgi:hypothetical protein